MVLNVPDLRSNLVSIEKICDKGHKAIFTKTKTEVFDRDESEFLTAKCENRLYYFRDLTEP